MMAGKKNKGEAKGAEQAGAGALQSSGVDDITRRLNGMQGQDEVTAQQVQCQQHVANILSLSGPYLCEHPSYAYWSSIGCCSEMLPPRGHTSEGLSS